MNPGFLAIVVCSRVWEVWAGGEPEGLRLYRERFTSYHPRIRYRPPNSDSEHLLGRTSSTALFKARTVGQYLLSLEPDRMLHSFRVNAGLSPKAEIYGGWESAPTRADIHCQGSRALPLGLFSHVWCHQKMSARCAPNVAGVAQLLGREQHWPSRPSLKATPHGHRPER